MCSVAMTETQSDDETDDGQIANTTADMLDLARDLREGEEIVWNDRRERATVVAVLDYEEKVTIRVETVRGATYRISIRGRWAISGPETTVTRQVSEKIGTSRAEYADEESLDRIEIVGRGADVEAPVEIGEIYHKPENDLGDLTLSATYFEIVDVDEEELTAEIALEDESPRETADSLELTYVALEDRLEGWEPVDDLEDVTVELPSTPEDDEDVSADGGEEIVTGATQEEVDEAVPDLEEEESNAHASRIAAQLAMADDDLVTDGGVDEPDTIVVRTDDGLIRANVTDVDFERPDDGARLGGSIDVDDPSVHYVDYWHADDSDDEPEPEIVTDGSGVVSSDDPRAEWCSSCQRYRINCTHSSTPAADGGDDTTNVSGGSRSRMADYKARAEELADETALTEAESRVAALKERGLTHATIAEELGIAKSTVDEYSVRIRRRVEESRRTLEEIDDDLTGFDRGDGLETDGGEIYRDDYVRVRPHHPGEENIALQVGRPPEEATPTISDARALRDSLNNYLEPDHADLAARILENDEIVAAALREAATQYAKHLDDGLTGGATREEVDTLDDLANEIERIGDEDGIETGE